MVPCVTDVFWVKRCMVMFAERLISRAHGAGTMDPADNPELAKYSFKRAIEELRDVTGRGTELISLYVPPDKQIFDVVAYLRNEYSQSSNIKSKGTKKNVMAAIDSIMSRLKVYKSPPENGVVLFVGHIPTSGDQTSMEAFVVEPPEPVLSFLYRCDNRFYIEPLEDMLVEKKCYGLIVIDRSEATIGLLKGKRIQIIKNIQSQVMGKHRQGGQSSVRFERLIEISVHEFFKKVGAIASESFMEEEELIGVIVGGPGSTKRSFAEKDYIHHELKNKLMDLVDTGYTDESGIRELVQNSETMLSDVELMKEKKLVNRFLQEVKKSAGGLATYGEKEVMKALALGAVEVLLVSEDMKRDLISLSCPSCSVQEHRMEKKKGEAWKCSKCSSDLVEEARDDAVTKLHEMASETSASVAIISGETEEGEMLNRAFGGLAAILRYEVNSFV